MSFIFFFCNFQFKSICSFLAPTITYSWTFMSFQLSDQVILVSLDHTLVHNGFHSTVNQDDKRGVSVSTTLPTISCKCVLMAGIFVTRTRTHPGGVTLITPQSMALSGRVPPLLKSVAGAGTCSTGQVQASRFPPL